MKLVLEYHRNVVTTRTGEDFMRLAVSLAVLAGISLLPVSGALTDTGTGSTAPVARGEWRLWSPRPQISPKLSHDEPTGELVLEGGGNPAVFGGWERTYCGIRAGQWYRLQVRYRATGLDYEPLQTPVRLDWATAKGQRAGQPDYAWQGRDEGGWRLVTLDAPAPEGAEAVKIQLLLQNAARAHIRFKDVTLTPVGAPPQRLVRIATVRLSPKGADPVAAFIALVDSRVPDKTDIIVLPEGIAVVGTGKKLADVAEPVPGPVTERLGELARRKGAWLVAGVYELDGEVIYNTAVLINRAGQLAGKYRKVYIPREKLEGGITPGWEYPVFETDFGKIGMMICWDVQYADPARGLALRGAEMILMPIWDGNQTLAEARAIENHLFLITSGYGIPSLILDPMGTELAGSAKDGTVVTATIDLSRRYLDEWLGDMRARYFRELRGDLQTDPPGRK